MGYAEGVAVPLPDFFVGCACRSVGDQPGGVEVVGIDVIRLVAAGADGGFEHGYGLFVQIDGFIQVVASAVVFAKQLAAFVVHEEAGAGADCLFDALAQAVDEVV